MEPMDRLPDEDILHLTSLEEVFGGFAHEIAQPLHTIMIASQVLQLKLARTDLADEEKEFLTQRLNIVISQVQRATEIIGGLRAFAKGAFSQQDATDIRLIFRHVQELMGQQFLGRGIELVCHMDDSLASAGEKPQLIEGIIIQGLAHARDTVTALDAWHKKNETSYKRSLAVTVSGKSSLTICMSWDPGQGVSIEGLPNAGTRPGLIAANAILKSAGGGIEADGNQILIWFP